MEYHGIKIMGGEFESYGIRFLELPGGSTDYLDFQNDSGVSMMVIENTGGFVGIGTTNPYRLLSLYKNSTDQVLISFQNSDTGVGLSAGFMVGIYPPDEDAYLWNFENSDMLFANNNDEKMRILAGGNVGIGTNNPGEKLSVDGNIETYDGHYVMTDRVRARDGDGLRLTDDNNVLGIFIQDGGRIGIGTTDPGSKLHVQGVNVTEATVIIENDGSPPNGMQVAFYSEANEVSRVSVYSADSTTGYMGFHTMESNVLTEQMRILSNGRVGIGINNPSSLLHVDGTFQVQNGTDINEISIDGTLLDNSDDAVPTEKAVKTYVDGHQFDHGGLSGLEDDDHPQYRLKQELISYEDANFTVDSTSFDELKCFVIDSTGPVTVTIDPVSLSEVGYEVELVFWDSTASPRTVTIQASGTDKIGNSSSGGTMYNMVNIPTEEQFSIRLKVVQPGMIAVMAVVGMWDFT